MAGIEIPLFLSSATAFEQSQLIRLGETSDIIFTANAFYTMISDMLIDGGIFAVVFFTSLFGFAYGHAIQSFTSATKHKNLFCSFVALDLFLLLYSEESTQPILYSHSSIFLLHCSSITLHIEVEF